MAAPIGTNAVIRKLSMPGCTITSKPMKPTSVAIQRFLSTFSFSQKYAIGKKNNGSQNMIAVFSAKGIMFTERQQRPRATAPTMARNA